MVTPCPLWDIPTWSHSQLPWCASLTMHARATTRFAFTACHHRARMPTLPPTWLRAFCLLLGPTATALTCRAAARATGDTLPRPQSLPWRRPLLPLACSLAGWWFLHSGTGGAPCLPPCHHSVVQTAGVTFFSSTCPLILHHGDGGQLQVHFTTHHCATAPTLHPQDATWAGVDGAGK